MSHGQFDMCFHYRTDLTPEEVEQVEMTERGMLTEFAYKAEKKEGKSRLGHYVLRRQQAIYIEALQLGVPPITAECFSFLWAGGIMASILMTFFLTLAAVILPWWGSLVVGALIPFVVHRLSKSAAKSLKKDHDDEMKEEGDA